MSKASEWAEYMAVRRDAPQFRARSTARNAESGEEWFAAVTDYGDLSLRGLLGKDEALKLRDWLTDVFEPKEEP